MSPPAPDGMERVACICDLLASSLLPSLESKPFPLTKESEKQLLLSLSKVYKEIQQLGKKLNRQQDQDSAGNSFFVHNCLHLEEPFDGDCKCLANIISIIVAFFDFDSRYVQHLTGNITSTISSSLVTFEGVWNMFISLIWVTLEAAISSLCSYTPFYFADGSFFLMHESSIKNNCCVKDKFSKLEISKLDIANFIALLHLRCTRMSWQTVAELFQVLRSILKSLRRDNPELEAKYIYFAVLVLQRFPWDIFSKEYEMDSNNTMPGLRGILSGAILQLICSIVKQTAAADVKDGFVDEQNIYSVLVDLIPRLLSCFCDQTEHHSGLSQYLRHKMLMLMIRLSSHVQWSSQLLVSWLKLLRQFFQDVLFEPILHHIADSRNCLEGSPFLSSTYDCINLPNSDIRHLQRQAIFLFLKCGFTLIRVIDESSQQCSCAKESPMFARELKVCCDACSLIGFSEISELFRRCGRLEKPTDQECLSKSSTGFALSFLQQYMEEDDMLFSLLLLLMDAPSASLQKYSNEKKLAPDEITIDRFSSFFDPVCLFHLLLLSLNYDHMVLADYLISTDTAVPCAQYLLRCLREIPQSWHSFVHFLVSEDESEKPYYKRRKMSMDLESFNGKSGPSSLVFRVSDPCEAGRHKLGVTKTTKQAFRNAKQCLLSLKKTLEDLHQKNLFPYNPKPLVRSLSRFQELCEKH